MPLFNFLYRSLAALLVILPVWNGPVRADDTRASRELLTYYLDLVKSGNYESACGLWEPASYARSIRLGIQYNNIPIKPDFNSPVMQEFKLVKSYLPDGVISKAIFDSNVVRWKFRAEDSTFTRDHFYFTVVKDGYPWIIAPADYYTAGWSLTTTRYFRIYADPKRESELNSIALNSLDEFVTRTAATLGIVPERRKLLEETKIDYYLCNTDLEVEKITGIRDRGVYDPAYDAVVTTFLPHFHEIALLLVNFRLQHLPPATQPFIQYGFATYLGGRWQRSPAVVFDFGEYILKYKIIDIDSILTFNDFHNLEGGDVSYPVSSCLVEYLYEQLGLENFLALYGRLAGDRETIMTMTADTVRSIITDAVNMDWEQFNAGFQSFLEERGRRAGLIIPGQIEADQPVLENSGLRISTSDKWLQVVYQDADSTVGDITFLFDRCPELDSLKSMLFEEQFRGSRKFPGFRYGIRLDRNEIGLYDYAANQIKAKYIADPESSGIYYDPDKNRVTAYFGLDLLDGALPQKDNYQIIK